ncbi:hypothetical protein [Flavobacterium sp. WC2429]|uniref:Uncharacterized protein n=1 Tax=Flavobacterium sp. WC2429 TaxID=3234140 RepID=A0AB39WM30_9FLAO
MNTIIIIIITFNPSVFWSKTNQHLRASIPAVRYIPDYKNYG